MEEEKIFANDMINKGLISKIYKQFIHLNNRIKQQLNQKMGRRPKQTFLQRRHTDGQETPEKVLNITNYQRNANQITMNLIVITTLVAQLVKNLSAMQETWVRSLGWEDSWERERLPISVFWPREFHGLYSSCACNQSGMTEQLSLSKRRNLL